ncbi:MAG: hypothetical protein IT424_12015, partial [Pirellulales bacterium]|nr:hypothetical protein [Pirellulales bacterium]
TGLRRILVNERPIPKYAALNLAATNPYFNGGVMVVNLDLWRREGLARRMLQALHDHRQHVLYWDQYALNVVLSGRWKALDPRWNQNSYIFRETKWLASNFCLKQCPTYASDPWIVHFNWLKPWQAQCAHPFAEEFLQFVRGSRWAASIQSPQTPLPSENVRARPARSSRGMVRFLRNQTRRLFGKSAA